MADSEFRTYTYIEKVLGDLGWDTRAPKHGGSVYTQGEFRKHDSLLTEALDRKAPENIILIPWDGGHHYWIIEAKAAHKDLLKALNQAKRYADKINREASGGEGRSRFITGIAGTPDSSFRVETCYWDETAWQEVKINGYKTTGFLSFKQCQDILDKNNSEILDYDVDLNAFLKKANDINATLHECGVAAQDRARLVAGLLLALVEDKAMRISDAPQTLVGDVNGRIGALLAREGKEDFHAQVELKLPPTPENHLKYHRAIVQTMQHMQEMNIRSAINSGTDALGQFYETFLKYANDASEMGIVLTPRHITKFAVDVMNIRPDDTIFDPTCGTGGFFVAALDSIRAKHYAIHPDVYDAFRNDCLFGIEEADGVFGLALVNMIFRGDGKSRIHNGDCFNSKFIRRKGQVERLRKNDPLREDAPRPFSRVLMNPPFAREEKEYEFVDYALEQMQPDGLLFAILPNGPITGGQSESEWRKDLLKKHTVLAVTRMQDDLFSPSASKGTYTLIIEAWRPHKPNDPVYFAILHDDLHASQKSKLKGKAQRKDNMDRIVDELSTFLIRKHHIESVPKESSVSTLNMDMNYDFASEAYLEDDRQISTGISVQSLSVALTRDRMRQGSKPAEVPAQARDFTLQEIFNVRRGNCPRLKNLAAGDVPVITTSESWNGIGGYYMVEECHIELKNKMTISANGSGGKAFWHPYPFAALADVLICEPISKYADADIAFFLYVCDAIDKNAWRFDYYRKCSLSRLETDVRIVLPMKNDMIDFVFIKRRMKMAAGYANLMELLNE